jgi:hypothetical protein
MLSPLILALLLLCTETHSRLRQKSEAHKEVRTGKHPESPRMATAAHSITRFSTDADTLHSTVFRLARALREDGGDLWPQGEKGRGREAHTEPHHLVNLAIALAADHPFTDPPAAVRLFRSLVANALEEVSADAKPVRRTEYSAKPVGSGRLAATWHMYGNTLGSHLDGLVNSLAKPAEIELRRFLRAVGMTVTLTVGPTEARLTLPRPGVDQPFDRSEVLTYRVPQARLPIPELPMPGALRREITIPFALLETMADLWADTLAHRAAVAAKQQGKSASFAERETAAFLPGNAAATLDRDRNNDPGHNNTPESKETETPGQGVSCRGPDRPAPQRSDRHDSVVTADSAAA